MTDAQRANAVFSRSGISAAAVKPPIGLSRGSCAHGLRLSEKYLPAAMQLLQKTDVSVVNVYRQMPDGGYREVVW